MLSFLWPWLFLLLVAGVAALWAYINLSTTFRATLRYVLHPWDAHAADNAADNPVKPGLENDPPHEAIADAAQRFEQQEAPPVAILCPGRNEADHLPETLPELCAQDYPACRVVFVDDHSDDATPRITAECAQQHAHLSVLRNEQEPPAGWVGKCWALHRAGEHLAQWEAQHGRRAEWLCFTDADIHWDPRCLRSAMALAMHTGADVVALGPKLVFGGASEALVQLQLMLAIGLILPIEKSMDPDHPDTLTGGAFILVRRSLYEKIGGHEAVRDQVVDDINLGRALKREGGRIRVALAPQLQWARMYTGWRDMWEGLTKNAYAGLEYKPHWAAGLGAAVLVANILPPVYLVASIAWCIIAPSWWAGAAIGLSALIILLTARTMNAVRKLAELPTWYAWTMPVGSSLYLAIVAASVWRYYRGGNVWKGRTYNRASLQSAERTRV